MYAVFGSNLVYVLPLESQNWAKFNCYRPLSLVMRSLNWYETSFVWKPLFPKARSYADLNQVTYSMVEVISGGSLMHRKLLVSRPWSRENGMEMYCASPAFDGMAWISPLLLIRPENDKWARSERSQNV